MKLAVIGANGQLGTDVCRTFTEKGDDVVMLTHDRIDITDKEKVIEVLGGICADVVVNTAAMHHVEKCENDPAAAFQVNGAGAMHLSAICNQTRSLLVHISTDYVFDGEKHSPYIESDAPMPLNVYGNTKLSGEYFIRSTCERYHILRVSGLYGHHPCRAKGLNFVDLMVKLSGERDEVRVVDDEIVSPTFTKTIAEQIHTMVDAGAQNGVYHVTSEGRCSWYEFAREIFALTRSSVTLNRAAPDEFPMKVNRPKYSVLENGFLKEQKINVMPDWRDALKDYLAG